MKTLLHVWVVHGEGCEVAPRFPCREEEVCILSAAGVLPEDGPWCQPPRDALEMGGETASPKDKLPSR